MLLACRAKANIGNVFCGLDAQLIEVTDMNRTKIAKEMSALKRFVGP